MNTNIILIVACIVVILICIYIITCKEPTSIDIVIARYNEDLDWLCNELTRIISNSNVNTSIYIYNKGNNEISPKVIDCFDKVANLHVIQLPNVGRCDHTYLHHIIQNYTSLADVTVFIPASCDMVWKDTKTIFLLDKVYKEKDTVFIDDDPSNIYESEKNFSLSNWMSSHESNKLNDDDTMMLASPRPFGEWYMHIFGKNELHRKSITYAGILAISRKHISNRTKMFYENLISHIDKHQNPEAGHYIERSWSAIFQVPVDRKFSLP